MKVTTRKINSQEQGLLNFLAPVTKVALPLTKKGLTSLAKSVLIHRRLTTASSATDAAILKKTFGPRMTTLIILNKEMNDIMKIVKSLKDTCLLMKSVGETIENEVK